MLKVTEAALSSLGNPSAANSPQMRDLVQMLMDQKQSFLQQLRETRPLDQRLHARIRLEKKQSRDLDECTRRLQEAEAALNKVTTQRSTLSRTLADTRRELKALYAQYPNSPSSSDDEGRATAYDPYARCETYDLDMLACTTEPSSSVGHPPGSVTCMPSPTGHSSVLPDGPRAALLADAAVLGFQEIDPATIPNGPPVEDATLAWSLEAAQMVAAAMPLPEQQQPSHQTVAARPFRGAKSRSNPYQGPFSKDKNA